MWENVKDIVRYLYFGLLGVGLSIQGLSHLVSVMNQLTDESVELGEKLFSEITTAGVLIGVGAYLLFNSLLREEK